ncbi:MAG TPA: TlpA disulfide reductase family protein [Candidatus Hodarchaeales archaeon]|nr:TlpA disulfide reductase family protein [Candidatus Hodarchaeales archaeon]
MSIRLWLKAGLLGVVVVLYNPIVTRTQEQVESGRRAEAFVLPTWDGKVLKSSSLKGQVIMLEFFQTWCPDCQKAAPEIEQIYKRYKEKGFTVVGISHDKEGAKVVEPYVKKYSLTYPVVIGDLSIAVSYTGLTPAKPGFRIPFIVLIDRNGLIAGQYEEGKNDEATDPKLLEALIKKLL